MPVITGPTTWEEVLKCPCRSCTALTEIYNRCTRFDEWLYVLDVRPFDAGFAIGNARLDFRLALVERDLTLQAAADYVFARQGHADVFMSSFPMRVLGERDYRYRRYELKGADGT